MEDHDTILTTTAASSATLNAVKLNLQLLGKNRKPKLFEFVQERELSDDDEVNDPIVLPSFIKLGVFLSPSPERFPRRLDRAIIITEFPGDSTAIR